MQSDAEPIDPLRACREIDAVVDDDTIIVGDGGDFVGTAAYTVKAAKARAVARSGSVRHARRRPRLRDGRQAGASEEQGHHPLWRRRVRSPRHGVRSDGSPEDPRRGGGRQRRRLDADPPRPGAALRTGPHAGDGALATRATIASSKRSAGTASTSRSRRRFARPSSGPWRRKSLPSSTSSSAAATSARIPYRSERWLGG